MKKTIMQNDKINETIHVCEYDNGLKAFVIPKKGYTKKYSVYATKYGSIDSNFIDPMTKQNIVVPDGIAHFLEHKLFEQEDGINAMDRLTEMGASCNAYTTFDRTVYLASCTENFQNIFKYLLKYVQNPYFTDENIEKEKGIINQEIRMGEDDPISKVYYSFLKALYRNNPVRIEIAGTIDSVSKIDKDILYTCYNTFYNPNNMMVIVSGDVDVDAVFEDIEKSQKLGQIQDLTLPEIERIYPIEPIGLNQSYIENKMHVSQNIFVMGFKGKPIEIQEDKRSAYSVGIRILLEMILGKSSRLYQELYQEGLITFDFDVEYSTELNYSYSTISGESKNPEAIRDRLIKEINSITKNGLNKDDFERIKKKMIGSIIKLFNSVDNSAELFLLNYMKGIELFDFVNKHYDITFEEVQEMFVQHFDVDCLAMSVVKPI